MLPNKKKALSWIIVLIILISFVVVLSIKKEAKNWDKALEKDITNFEHSADVYRSSFLTAISLNNNIEQEFNIDKIDEKNKKKFNADLRKKIKELLNFPLSEIPKSAISLENLQFHTDKLPESTVEKEKYTEKKFYFFTSNLTYSVAYLLIPKNVEFPAPAVIAMHQHGGTKYGIEEIVGNVGDNTLFYAKELAERGYVVLAVDSDTFGNKMHKNESSLETIEKIIAQSLFARGLSPLSIIVQEDLVSLELLLSMDIVDKEKVGCIGHSFGGIRCMYLAALDERVKAVVLSGSISDIRKVEENGITYTWLNILPGIGKYAETKEILGLIAPRPLMTFSGEFDPIFPPAHSKEQLVSLEELYKRLGKESSNLNVFMVKKYHEFPVEFHEIAYKFLDDNLKN
jgi:hypothetical protein